ncbi:MAG: recombinase family protein [Planctomycetota bacterium]|jgi:DNA invertase Pin-like site-specific DNA recombinase|nr:recombinase family protein [Planctomycetota bacterium]
MNRSTDRAIGYVRVSTTDQIDGYSLETQSATITSWAKRHGLTLVDIIRSEGESGKDLDRSSYRALQQRLQTEDITRVIVVKLDRLSRNLRDVADILETWDDQGVSLVAIDDGLHGTAGSNRLIAHMLAWIAEDERKRIRGRIMPGKRARVESGLPPSRTPFGYRIVDNTLRIHPERGPLVRELFALAAQENIGPQVLATRMALRHPAHRSALNRGRIQGILANPIYTGTLSTRIGSQAIIRHNNHEALVDETTFLSVQSQRKQRAEARAQGGNDGQARSLLGGIMRCGVCGAGMTVVTAKGLPHYGCLSRFRTGGRCALPLIPADGVEQATLVRLVLHLDQLGHRLHEVWQSGAKRAGESWTAVHTHARHTLEQHDALVGQLVDQLAIGELSQAAFAERSETLTQRQRHAREQLTTIDVWSWLARLFGQDDNGAWQRAAADDGSIRLFLPLSVLTAQANQRDLRGMLRSAAVQISVDANEDLSTEWVDDPAAYTALAHAQGQAFRKGLVIDQRAVLRRQGYTLAERTDDGSERWDHPERPNSVVLPPPLVRTAISRE